MSVTVPNLAAVLAVVLSLALLVSGCSYTALYYGDEGSSQDSIDISEDRVKQRVLLIGDAGEPKTKGCGDRESCEPVLQVMEHWAKRRAGGKPPFSVFLGDNIYPRGMPDETKRRAIRRAEAKLRAQTMVLVNSESRGVFIPGNHDWGGTFGGYPEKWERQYELLKRAANEQKAQYGRPYLLVADFDSACPWPVSIGEDELEGVTIIALDTQWWLTPDNMTNIESCRRTSHQAIAEAEARTVAELVDLLKSAGDNEVIVVTHHPMASHGLHGSPLRFFSQDLRGLEYRRLINAIQGAYYESGARPLIHAAGHDHSLQVLKGVDNANNGSVSASYNLVSGAGSQAKVQSVGYGDDTLFAHKSTGFMVVDFMQNGDVFLQVIVPDGPFESNPNGKRVYATQLK